MRAAGVRQMFVKQRADADDQSRRINSLTRQLNRLTKSLSWTNEAAGGALVGPAGASCSTGSCGIADDGGDDGSCSDWAATYLAAGEVLKGLGAQQRQTQEMKALRSKVMELGGDYIAAGDLDEQEKSLEEAILKTTTIAGSAIRKFFYGGCRKSWCPTHPTHPACRTR